MKLLLAISNIFLTSHRHQEAVCALLTELMRKFQFRYNQSELDALDHETVDSDTVR